MNMMDMIDVFEGIMEEGNRPVTIMELEGLWSLLEEYEDALGEVSAVLHREMANLEALPMYVDEAIEAHDEVLLFIAELYDGIEEVRTFLDTYGQEGTMTFTMCALLEESLVEGVHELHVYVRDLYADDLYYGVFLPIFESIGLGEVTIDEDGCDCGCHDASFVLDEWEHSCGCETDRSYVDCHCYEDYAHDESDCDCGCHQEESYEECHCGCHDEEESCDCACHDEEESCHCDCHEELADPFEEDQVYWTVEGDDLEDDEDVEGLKEELKSYYYDDFDDEEDKFDDDDFDEEALAKLARLVEEKKRKVELADKAAKKEKKEKKKKKDKKEKKSKEEKAAKKAKKLQKKIEKIKALAEEVHGAQARMILASLEEKLGLEAMVKRDVVVAQEEVPVAKRFALFGDDVKSDVEEDMVRSHRKFSFSALLEDDKEGDA